MDYGVLKLIFQPHNAFFNLFFYKVLFNELPFRSFNLAEFKYICIKC